MNIETVDSKKGNNTIKYIIFSLVFFVLGLLLGVVCTNKVLQSKDKEKTDVVEEKDVVDITDSDDYKNTITKLLNILNKNTIFYNSNGVSLLTMANDTKLNIVYDYIINNKTISTEEIDAVSWTATVCNHDFLVKYAQNADGTNYNTGKCDVQRISFDLMNDTYQELFNDINIDLTQPFLVSNSKKCEVEETGYVCGTILDNSGITGTLESKFNVEKVTKEKDGTIKIYEKGYLVDTRSNIVNPDDGYDNYYLHSSDSTAYYYELRSADNYTFIHTFKLNEKNNYYYVDTILQK